MAHHSKQSRNWKIKMLLFVTGLIVGAIGGVFVYSKFVPSQSNETHVETLSPTTVFSRIQDQGELVSASQDYTIVDKVTDQNRDLFNLFDIPFTKNSFWYRYTGTIKAGVNMKTAEIKQDDTDQSKLHITLDQPYIISNTPDMDKSGVLEEHNNKLNMISIDESDAFQKQCQERSQQEAIDGGLMDETKTNAESDLNKMFNAAFGEDTYTIDYTYRDNSPSE